MYSAVSDSLVGERVRFSEAMSPRLLVVVHTEEEFDWSAPFSRLATATSHVPALARPQAICRAHGFAPTYMCGYPIADDPAAVEVIGGFLAAGEAHLGAHLHPWVCPPADEEVNTRNSYPGNLPPALERAKLARLTERIETAFGRRPRAYLAGRYGIGPATAGSLAALGYLVDLSPAPGFDYRAQGGPDFLDFTAHAFWNARHPSLLHIPHTGGHIGFLCRGGQRRVRGEGMPFARAFHVPGILARLGAVEPARLTIEGMALEDMKALTRALHADGARVFVLSFHSPSADIGFTPYVRTAADLDRLMATLDAYLAFFARDMQGAGASCEEIHALASAGQSAALARA